MVRTVLMVIGLYLVLGIFEFHFPAQSGQTREGRLRNIRFTAIFLLAGTALVSLVYFLLPLETRVHADSGMAFSIVLLLMYLFLIDFIFYWYHRAQHAFRWFWPIHELHHSDAELNATTSMRTYWLERPLQALAIVAPVNYFIGVDPTAIALLPFVATGWLFFTHANWRLDLGPLTALITGPQLHRIHHSNLPQHQNRNFAQFFPVIDILFGTYYRPAKDEYPTTGTPELASDAPITKTLIRPLKVWSTSLKGKS